MSLFVGPATEVVGIVYCIGISVVDEVNALEGVAGFIEIVNVVPQPKAGGSFATTCYKNFSSPVAAVYIKADAGMDIGLTLIGMHLKSVAVPVRLSIDKIGCANVVFARTRPRCIGGIRAIYDDNLM